MAQALLNNLNNIKTDEIYSINKFQDSADVSGFDFILGAKSSEISTSDEVTDVITEAELAAAIEYAVDNVTEAQNLENEGDVLGEVESTDTEDDENITTITDNEDSTMNIQLQAALENPTSVILLQSQLNTAKQNNQNSENENALIQQNTTAKNLISDKANICQSDGITFDSAKTNQKQEPSSSKTLRDVISDEMIEELNIEAVSSSASENNETSSDLMQQQTPQEQAVKIMLQDDITFDDIKIVSNVKTTAEANPARILDQITRQMESMNNTSKLNIVLNPETLGKVMLQIINSKEGLTAHFTVTNQDTQNALIKGLAGLRESLLAQGISVDNVVVKMSEGEFESEYKFDWTEQENSKNGQREQGGKKQKQEEKDFEQMMFEINNQDLG